jgi:hypothetical protein
MDLAVNFNNIGVALHRLQRYEEAEEMFRGAVRLLLRSQGGCVLFNQGPVMNLDVSRCEQFDALVQDDQVRLASSKMEDRALHADVGTGPSWPSTTPGSEGSYNTLPSSNRSSSPLRSSQVHHHHQDFPSARDIPQAVPTRVQESHQQGSPVSSSERSSSFTTFKDPQPRRLFTPDEFSVYLCLEAFELNATSTVAVPVSLAAVIDTSSYSLPQDHHNVQMDAAVPVRTTASAANHHDNAIGRYDFETIVVLYNMALTLLCLGQLTLSCYIYGLADHVLCGLSMETVRNDPITCRLALAISNNLGQILLRLGYLDIARVYVYRLADFLLCLDPPVTKEQAKERLEFILNIYWFDHPPGAAAA